MGQTTCSRKNKIPTWEPFESRSLWREHLFISANSFHVLHSEQIAKTANTWNFSKQSIILSVLYLDDNTFLWDISYRMFHLLLLAGVAVDVSTLCWRWTSRRWRSPSFTSHERGILLEPQNCKHCRDHRRVSRNRFHPNYSLRLPNFREVISE